MASEGGRFRQAGVPVELAKEIVALIRAHPELGFRTLSEFMRHAAIEQLRLVHMHLALKAVWTTTDLGAEAVEALLRDSLPRDYRAFLERSRSGRERRP